MGKKRSGLAINRKAYSWDISTFIISILNGIGSSDISNLTQVSIPGALYDAGAPGFSALEMLYNDEYDEMQMTVDYELVPKKYNSYQEMIDFMNNDYPLLIIPKIQNSIPHYIDRLSK